MMQRSPFPPPNPKSPELFHPRPQHISQVPMMRSPPPPQQQQQQQPQQPQMNNYGNPYQSPPLQPGAAAFGGNFGNFMTDPTAQMGFQVGKSAMMAGQEYMEQNLNRYISVSALKHYFNVSNSYVVRKLLLVLLPWRHKPWTRQQTRAAGVDGQMAQMQYASTYLPPRDDLNSPDMYIPIMAFITYILLSTVLAGVRGSFKPELLGSITTSALAIIFLEVIILKVAMYLLNINNDSQLLDLAAYSGYKFVGAIMTLFCAEIFTGGRGTANWVGWMLFFYTWNANAFFLLRSLKYVLLPDISSDPTMRGGAPYTIARSQKSKRTYFLAAYAYIVQFVFMWALTRDEAAVNTVISKATKAAGA